MVKLHVKQGSEELIYETKVTASVDEVTRYLHRMEPTQPLARSLAREHSLSSPPNE